MENDLIVEKIPIKEKIYTIRGVQVILDRDLAELYEVETKQLNKAVKRNIKRFPADFMFQLTKKEFSNIKFQFGISDEHSLRFQNGTLKGRGKHSKYLPYVFTEQGVATLSGILRSEKAIEVNIEIMRAFIFMRKFISKNAALFQKIDSLEQKQIEYQITTDKRFEKVFKAIESKDIVPKQGIFFNGQIFDAYKFVNDLIRSAKKSVVLIDNYVDDTVLTLFTKRTKNVEVTIYTKKITEKLKLDLEKYNSQYPSILIQEFKNSHDRFLIIDKKEVYHIGASLKDLGKRWFAFSKLNIDVELIFGKLQ